MNAIRNLEALLLREHESRITSLRGKELPTSERRPGVDARLEQEAGREELKRQILATQGCGDSVGPQTKGMAAVTYTHCRGCGKELGSETPATFDGLCTSAGNDNCTFACTVWRMDAKGKLTAAEEFGDAFWRSPAWSVAIDE